MYNFARLCLTCATQVQLGECIARCKLESSLNHPLISLFLSHPVIVCVCVCVCLYVCRGLGLFVSVVSFCLCDLCLLGVQARCAYPVLHPLLVFLLSTLWKGGERKG